MKLKQWLKLPEFPELSALERKHFETEQAADLQPNAAEIIRFKKYLDSLKETYYKQRIPEKALPEIKGLIGHLDQFREKAAAMNGVSLGFINTLLTELIYGLRQSKGNMTNNEYNHLHNIVSDVKALAVIATPATSAGAMKAHSVDNYISFASYKGPVDYFVVVDPLLPVDIIVYRPAPPPAKPIMNAPDLKGVYRIFYTNRTLYNYRNPEINALSPGRLASTTHVSLPVYLKYKFWTLNMINHKTTLPQDIDIEEIISNNQKAGLKGKKTTVVLKVE